MQRRQIVEQAEMPRSDLDNCRAALASRLTGVDTAEIGKLDPTHQPEGGWPVILQDYRCDFAKRSCRRPLS